jgi:hypothetical protein
MSVRHFAFVSADSGNTYTLTLAPVVTETDEWIKCNCRGFRQHGNCKHAQDVIDFGILPESASQVSSPTTHHNKENKMNTTKKVVRNTAAAKKVVVRRARKSSDVPVSGAFPLDVPVNVKVAGERAMRKGVRLSAHPTDDTLVRVLSGGRGRPAHLPVSSIEKVRVLSN